MPRDMTSVDFRRPMSPTELSQARARLGKSEADLAEQLDVDVEIVQGWERGERPIPRLAVRRIRWLVAGAERDEALEASGLAACDWVADWGSAPLPEDGADATLKHFELLHEHVESCPTCQARQRFIAERFGPLPRYPAGGAVGLTYWVFDRIESIPGWLRAPVVGALILAAVVAIRVVFAIPRILRSPVELLDLVVALGAAAGAGAAGGMVYSIVRPPLRRLGRPGDYLTGMAVVAGYLGALILAAPIAFGESLVEGTEGWIIWAGMSVFFGLVVGHAWFRSSTS